MTSRIFISHASEDKDVADKVILYLESHGQRCWIAPRDIPPGADWAVSIIDGIDSASFMVLILSEHSNKSPQVRREVERAVSKGVTIIPLIVEKIELSKWMQYYISAHQWYDVTESPLERRLPELLKVLDTEIHEEEISPDLSDLSSLLEKDLDRLTLALDAEEGKTEYLLPGERRRVSVLQVRTKLTNSKIHSSARDTISKTIDNLINRFLKVYGGYLEDKSENGYRCVFGIEKTLEDDSHRAVSSGIRLFNAFGELNSVLRSKGFSVDFGLGVASGMLEVEQTEVDHPESSGDVLIVAEDLSVEASNELLSAKSVYRVSKDQFAWEEHSEDIYRIADYSITNPETKILSIHSPFVGREEELSILRTLLDRQEQGTDRNRRGGSKHLVLGIKGEAGIGKSRLVHEFIKRNCENEDILLLKGQTLSYAQPPYWLWTTLLRNLLNIEFGSGLEYEEFLERLTELSYDEDLINSAPFLSELMSIKSGDKRLEELDNKAIALETRIAFRNLLKVLSIHKNIFVVLEDLHWIHLTDRTVLEFVVGNCDTDIPIVFLLLYRPECEDNSFVEFDIYPNLAEVEEVQIVEVDEEASTHLAEELLKEISESGSRNIAPQVRAFLLDHSRGNPFYLEELVLDLLESGTLVEHNSEWKFEKPINDIFVPYNLASLLQSRLDRLPEVWRSVLQFSSVLGMEFQVQLLHMLAERVSSDKDVLPGLDGLEHKHMLISEKSAFEKKYLFKHMLVHDTAYGSILEENLQKLHRAAAESIEEMFKGEKERVSGILMHHWDKTGNIPKVIEWGMIAADRAKDAYANQDAINSYSRVLECLPESGIENKVREIEVLMKRASVLNLVGDNEKAIEDLTQAIGYSQSLGEKKLEADGLVALCKVHFGISHYTDTIEMAESALKIYRELVDRKGESNCLNCIGIANWYLGEFERALKLYQNSLIIALDIGDRQLEAMILGNISIIYWNIDEYSTSLDFYIRALEITRELGDVETEARALNNIGLIHATIGDNEKAMECYERSLEISRKICAHELEASTLNNTGLINTRLGEYAKAIDNYKASLSISRETGTRKIEAMTLNNIGALYCDLGNYASALEYCTNSLRISREIDDRQTETESLSVLGKISLNKGELSDAEEYYRKALSIARTIKSKSLLATVLIGFTSLCLEKNDLVMINEKLNRVLHLIDKKNYRKIEAKIHYLLDRLLTKEKKWVEVKISFDELISFFDRENLMYEGIILGDLGLLDFEDGNSQKALKEYNQAYKIISELSLGEFDFKEGFIELHRKLLSAGYSEDKVPWPSHWDYPENLADQNKKEF